TVPAILPRAWAATSGASIAASAVRATAHSAQRRAVRPLLIGLCVCSGMVGSGWSWSLVFGEYQATKTSDEGRTLKSDDALDEARLLRGGGFEAVVDLIECVAVGDERGHVERAALDHPDPDPHPLDVDVGATGVPVDDLEGHPI